MYYRKNSFTKINVVLTYFGVGIPYCSRFFVRNIVFCTLSNTNKKLSTCTCRSLVCETQQHFAAK